MLKVLVLGGTGFIGKRLFEKLNLCGYKVFSTSRKNGLDLKDLNSIKKNIEIFKPNVIFNCAAHVGSVHYVSTYMADVISDNTQMVLNLYEALKNYPEITLINPIANCSYPGNKQILKEDEWLDGDVHPSVFSYGHARRMVYALSKCYYLQYGIKSINFLVPNVYGPGDHIDPKKTHALNGMIIRMLCANQNNDKKFEIWGTGNPIREWIFIDDVINVFLLALKFDKPLIYPINIGQKKGYSIKESAELIAKIIKYKGDFVYNCNYQDGAPQKIMDNKLFYDTIHSFTFTDHKKGLLQTIEYYKKILAIN